MLELQTGTFFGAHHKVIKLPGLVITDTQYTKDKVDWHYHQNPYFTFLLQGSMLEANKKERYECLPGTLLYHHWQDAHYNVKGRGFVQGLHVELSPFFAAQFELNLHAIEGSLQLHNPMLKSIFQQLYLESKINDSITALAVEVQLLRAFELLNKEQQLGNNGLPKWVKRVKEALHHCTYADLSLNKLATIADVHPVHLSRDFPKYFNASIGQYLRQLQHQKACHLLLTDAPLTEITYSCGFADQSHFTRRFKKEMGISPLSYKKMMQR